VTDPAGYIPGFHLPGTLLPIAAVLAQQQAVLAHQQAVVFLLLLQTPSGNPTPEDMN
jgi:hypothetical protein